MQAAPSAACDQVEIDAIPEPRWERRGANTTSSAGLPTTAGTRSHRERSLPRFNIPPTATSGHLTLRLPDGSEGVASLAWYCRERADERRLAAILIADMAGYSRLMEHDEEGVLVRQKSHRRELINPEIAGRGGRIVKTLATGCWWSSAPPRTPCGAPSTSNQPWPSAKARARWTGESSYRIGINLVDILSD